MNFINYAVALPIVLGAFGASAWDSLTPREAFERCYAGSMDACTVARAYQQNQELYSSPTTHTTFRALGAPRISGFLGRLWQEKPGPFSPGELAR